jgi:hypothetical protein
MEKNMIQTKLKIAIAILLATGTEAGWFAHQARAQKAADKAVKKAVEDKTEVSGVAKAVDGAQNTIMITISPKGRPAVDRRFTVLKSAAVFIDDGKPKEKYKNKAKSAPAQRLEDVPIGAQVTLRLTEDRQSVTAVVAEGPTLHGTIKAVNAAKNTITLLEKAKPEKTYNVLENVVVLLDAMKEAKELADVPADAVADVQFLADQKTVRQIRAYGPTVFGTVQGQPGNDTITVRTKESEFTLPVVEDAPLLLNDNARGKLTDLIDGTVVQVRLSADKAKVLDLRAEGPSFQGFVRTLDPAQNLITLTIGSKGGVGGEEQEFKVTKATMIVTEINQVSLKLTDLKTDREVILRLSLDQKGVARITLLGE